MIGHDICFEKCSDDKINNILTAVNNMLLLIFQFKIKYFKN